MHCIHIERRNVELYNGEELFMHAGNVCTRTFSRNCNWAPIRTLHIHAAAAAAAADAVYIYTRFVRSRFTQPCDDDIIIMYHRECLVDKSRVKMH